MKREFVLGTIATLMNWNESQAREEFPWLRLMSRMKYDDYQEFRAGMRFVESLADWLQQFDQIDRECAYRFVRSRLVFLSEAEMRHLAELMYPEAIEPMLLTRTAEIADVPRYSVWADQIAAGIFQGMLSKSVFIELSDGARIDVFRRANEGRISNEQVVTAPRINKTKWDEMLTDLRDSLGDNSAKFTFVILVDDFTGSGKSLIRKDGEEWKGKLQRFWNDVNEDEILATHFDPDWTLVVHHYVATSQAKAAIVKYNDLRKGEGPWFKDVKFTWGTVLPSTLAMNASSDSVFANIVEQYYDHAIESRHMKVGGDDARWGFGSCGLPLVIEHNTPNNAIALLWAESASDSKNHAMRPLFRRRQRHV